MTKTYSRFITALFCVFRGGLFVWHLALPDRASSETENRTLAQFPAFSWEGLKDGTFTADVEEYIADQFPMRDTWTGLKARAEQFLGKREFNGVYLAGDTLITKIETPDMELVEKNFSYFQRLLGTASAHVQIGLIPSAAEIWKEKLPAGAYSWDQKILLEMAAEKGLPTVNLFSALEAHKEEPIYYRTDHHWSTLGAFYGANAILEAYGKETLKESDFTVETASDAFCGTLYSQSGIHWLPEDVMEYWVSEDGLSVESWRNGRPENVSLYDRTWLEKKDKYSSFLGGNQPLCVIRNENLPEDAGKILLVRDSYSDALAPFLAQRFAEVHLFDLRMFRSPVSQYAAQNGIDEILVLYSVQNFITDPNMVFLT